MVLVCFVAVWTFSLVQLCQSKHYIRFDDMSASSVYNGGVEGNSFGGHYWCSSGSHPVGQVVSWTGSLATKHKSAGIRLNWAYRPNEFKVLTSPDGANFVETASWHAASQEGASYVENVMFDDLLPVRAIAVVMRGPGSSGYFGLNAAALLVEPGPSMLMSDVSVAAGDQCVVASAGVVVLQPCLDVVASGTGIGIFNLIEEGLLVSAFKPSECIQMSSSGNTLEVGPCSEAKRAEGGRGIFEFNDEGQLKVGFGTFCVVSRATGISVGSCEDASKFSMVAVPKVDLVFGEAMHEAADMALKAGKRLQGAVAQLKTSLASCGLIVPQACGGNCKEDRLLESLKSITEKSFQKQNASANEATSLAQLIESMNMRLRIDGLDSIIADARKVLSSARE